MLGHFRLLSDQRLRFHDHFCDFLSSDTEFSDSIKFTVYCIIGDSYFNHSVLLWVMHQFLIVSNETDEASAIFGSNAQIL